MLPQITKQKIIVKRKQKAPKWLRNQTINLMQQCN